MADFSRFLLVSDFDHTLTDHTGQIPRANLDAISYFIEHGGVFTICTGRSLPAAQGLLQEVPINAPLLFCNGAACYDTQNKNLIFCHALPENAADMIEFCRTSFPDLRLEVHTLHAHYAFGEDPRRDAVLRRRGTDHYYPEQVSQIPAPWVKFSLYSRDGDVATIDPESERWAYFQKAAKTINHRSAGALTATHSLPGLVEVQKAGTSKGLAARELAQTLNRPVLVCVGDAPNDIPMLEEADLPFLASDGEAEMMAYPFPKVAPSSQGTVADVIKILQTL